MGPRQLLLLLLLPLLLLLLLLLLWRHQAPHQLLRLALAGRAPCQQHRDQRTAPRQRARAQAGPWAAAAAAAGLRGWLPASRAR
jgi:hypothetical protein